jgi:hypothetical protein
MGQGHAIDKLPDDLPAFVRASRGPPLRWQVMGGDFHRSNGACETHEK